MMTLIILLLAVLKIGSSAEHYKEVSRAIYYERSYACLFSAFYCDVTWFPILNSCLNNFYI